MFAIKMISNSDVNRLIFNWSDNKNFEYIFNYIYPIDIVFDVILITKFSLFH